MSEYKIKYLDQGEVLDIIEARNPKEAIRKILNVNLFSASENKGGEGMKDKELKELRELNEDLLDSDRTELVEVVWEDARTLSGTSDYIGIKENGLLPARTIGYLIYEDNKRIAICGFLFPDEHHSLQDPIQTTAFRDVHMIPKSCIKVIKILTIDWKRTSKFRDNNKETKETP